MGLSRLPQELIDQICEFMSPEDCPNIFPINNESDRLITAAHRDLAQVRLTNRAFAAAARRVFFRDLLLNGTQRDIHKLLHLKKYHLAEHVNSLSIKFNLDSASLWNDTEKSIKRFDELMGTLEQLKNINRMYIIGRYSEASQEQTIIVWITKMLARGSFPKLVTLQLECTRIFASLSESLADSSSDVSCSTPFQPALREIRQLTLGSNDYTLVEAFPSFSVSLRGAFPAFSTMSEQRAAVISAAILKHFPNITELTICNFRSRPTEHRGLRYIIPKIECTLKSLTIDAMVCHMCSLRNLIDGSHLTLESLRLKTILLVSGEWERLGDFIAEKCSILVNLKVQRLVYHPYWATGHRDTPVRRYYRSSFGIGSEKAVGFTKKDIDAFERLEACINSNRTVAGLEADTIWSPWSDMCTYEPRYSGSSVW